MDYNTDRATDKQETKAVSEQYKYIFPDENSISETFVVTYYLFSFGRLESIIEMLVDLYQQWIPIVHQAIY